MVSHIILSPLSKYLWTTLCENWIFWQIGHFLDLMCLFWSFFLFFIS